MPTSRKTYSELSEGIEKFFVADVTKLVSNKVPGFRESELRYLTFLYTCPLTTLFGMQSAMMPDRSHIKVGTNFFKGAFNNYVDKMGGGQKKSVFVHAQGIKTVH